MAKKVQVWMGFRGASYDAPTVLEIGPPINQRETSEPAVEIYERDAQTLFSLLCGEIPAGTLDQLMVLLVKHRSNMIPDNLYHEMARVMGQRQQG